MENNQIRVVINPDGLTAREINRYGDFEPTIIDTPLSWDSEGLEADIKKWHDAESKLRTFEIKNLFHDGDHPAYGEFIAYNWKPGSIHTAEIISEGRVKIIE